MYVKISVIQRIQSRKLLLDFTLILYVFSYKPIPFFFKPTPFIDAKGIKTIRHPILMCKYPLLSKSIPLLRKQESGYSGQSCQPHLLGS